MQTLSKEYLLLFNSVTDTVKELESIVYKLKTAQQVAEELVIAESESNTEPTPPTITV